MMENNMMEKIALLGPEYSHSHLAARKIFPDKEFLFCKKISDIFSAVENGLAGGGIAPIENMLNGSVRESIMSLLKHKMKINKSFNFPVSHCLASKEKSYEKIISHPQALAQCSVFLKDKDVVEVSSTSKAMQMAAEDSTLAAIGSVEAAEHFGLKIIADNVEDNHDNMTRFILISKEGREEHEGIEEEDGSYENVQTSLILDPKEDRPGLLFLILAPFAAQNINLNRIESLPSGRKMGDYVFYLEIKGSISDPKVKTALEFLKNNTDIYSFGTHEVVEIDDEN